MRIKESDHTLRISSDEAYNIACDIKSALKESVTRHWVNHPRRWREMEEKRIKRMKLFFNLANHERFGDDVVNECQRIIDNAQEEEEEEEATFK